MSLTEIVGIQSNANDALRELSDPPWTLKHHIAYLDSDVVSCRAKGSSRVVLRDTLLAAGLGAPPLIEGSSKEVATTTATP